MHVWYSLLLVFNLAAGQYLDLALGSWSGNILPTTSKRGFLLSRNSNGLFGLVCSDTFSWPCARAACKQLGRSPGSVNITLHQSRPLSSAYREFAVTHFSGCYLYPELLRTSRARSAGSCPSGNAVELDCGTALDAQQVWEAALTTERGEQVASGVDRGIVALRPAGSSQAWTPVCEMGFSSSAASTLCSALGYPSEIYRHFHGTSPQIDSLIYGSLPKYFDMQCLPGGAGDGRNSTASATQNGTVLLGDECSWSTGIIGGSEQSICDRGTAAYLRCDDSNHSPLRFQLSDQDGSTPGSGAAGVTSGFLTASRGGARGFACDYGFGQYEASVACRQMFGYAGGHVGAVQVDVPLVMNATNQTPLPGIDNGTSNGTAPGTNGTSNGTAPGTDGTSNGTARLLSSQSQNIDTLSSSGPLDSFSLSWFTCTSTAKGLSGCSWDSARSSCSARSDGVFLECMAQPGDQQVQVGLQPREIASFGMRPYGSVFEGVLMAGWLPFPESQAALSPMVEWRPVCASAAIAAMTPATARDACAALGLVRDGASWLPPVRLGGMAGQHRHALQGCSGGPVGSGSSTSYCQAGPIDECPGEMSAVLRCLPEEPVRPVLAAISSPVTASSLQDLSEQRVGVLVAAIPSTVDLVPVCADGFGMESALGVCSMLGFGDADVMEILWTTHEAPQGLELPIRRLKCPSNATSGALCTYTQDGICTSESLLYLRCGAPIVTDGWQFAHANRFSGSDAVPAAGTSSGKAIARYVTNGTASEWGTVCSSSIMQNSEKNLLCGLMGFGYDVPWGHGVSYSCCYDFFSPIGNLRCPWWARELGDCSYDVPGGCRAIDTVSCGSFNQVPVERGADVPRDVEMALLSSTEPSWNGTVGRQGILGARLQPDEPFKPYCVSSTEFRTSSIRDRVCTWAVPDESRSVEPAWMEVHVGAGVQTAPLRVQDCPATGDLQDPSSCEYLQRSSGYCGSRSGILLVCEQDDDATHSVGGVQVGLAGERSSADGPTDGYSAGVLRVRLESDDDDDEWGYVCPNGFSSASAQRVCEALGFGTNSSTVSFGNYTSDEETEYPVEVFSCLHDGPCAFNLADITDGDVLPCSEQERVWVDCGRYHRGSMGPLPRSFAPPTDQTGPGLSALLGISGLNFRFTAIGKAPRPYLKPEYRFQVFEVQASSGSWRAACGYWDDHEAEHICTAMGEPGKELYLESLTKSRWQDLDPVRLSVDCEQGFTRGDDDENSNPARACTASVGSSASCSPQTGACVERQWSDDEYIWENSVKAARRLAIQCDASAIVAICFSGLGVVLGSIAAVSLEAEEKARAGCGYFAPLQALGTLMSIIVISAELVSAKRFTDEDDYDSIQMLGIICLAGLAASVFINVASSCIVCCSEPVINTVLNMQGGWASATRPDQEGAGQPRASTARQDDAASMGTMLTPCCICCVENRVCLATPRISDDCDWCGPPIVPASDGDSRDALHAFVYRAATLRLCLFEGPVLAMLIRVRTTLGGWLCLDAAIVLLCIHAVCTLARLGLWWNLTHPESRLGYQLSADVAGCLGRRKPPRPPALELHRRSGRGAGARAQGGEERLGRRNGNSSGGSQDGSVYPGLMQAAPVASAPPIASSSMGAPVAPYPSSTSGMLGFGHQVRVTNPMSQARMRGQAAGSAHGDSPGKQEEDISVAKKMAAAAAGVGAGKGLDSKGTSAGGVAAYPVQGASHDGDKSAAAAGGVAPYPGGASSSNPYGSMNPALTPAPAAAPSAPAWSPHGGMGPVPDAQAGAWNAGYGETYGRAPGVASGAGAGPAGGYYGGGVGAAPSFGGGGSGGSGGTAGYPSSTGTIV